MSNATRIVIAETFQGPPGIGHGGHIAGHFADIGAVVQVTLRRPAPLDVDLEIVSGADGARELRHDGALLAEAVPGVLDLEVPPPPVLAAARDAEAESPSYADGIGVHPTCFGCGLQRADGSGLRIAAGPVEVDGFPQVAAVWTPPAEFATEDGMVEPRHVIAALDCPGAFAFMVRGDRPGLLGRITFEIHAATPVGEPQVVTGWQIGRKGTRMLAGTALFSADGELRAAASAVWFPATW